MKEIFLGTSLVVQWLRNLPYIAGLCGTEAGSLTYPQPYIRLYYSQGTSRIQLQGDYGAFGGLLCGKGEGHIAGLP